MAKDATKTTAAPKITWKGQQEFRHDLFKLEPAICKRNQSYTTGMPQIEDVTHTHHFHSVDRAGKVCVVASMACGHTHEVKVQTADDGSLKASCGPAIKEVKTKTKNVNVAGKKKLVPVQWKDDALSSDEDQGYVVDTHTHAVTYKWSEVISPNQLKAQQEQDSKKLGDMMGASTRLGPQPTLIEQGE